MAVSNLHQKTELDRLRQQLVNHKQVYKGLCAVSLKGYVDAWQKLTAVLTSEELDAVERYYMNRERLFCVDSLLSLF